MIHEPIFHAPNGPVLLVATPVYLGGIALIRRFTRGPNRPLFESWRGDVAFLVAIASTREDLHWWVIAISVALSAIHDFFPWDRWRKKLSSKLSSMTEAAKAAFQRQQIGGILVSNLPPVLVPHPHVRVDPNVLGGSPYVIGSRILVRRIYGFYQAGASFEKLAKRYPQLGPAKVLDALSFTEEAVCGCDESKAWRNRALAAELALRFARGQLRRLVDSLDRILNPLPGEDVVGTDGEVIGQTLPTGNHYVADSERPGVARKLVSWMAEQIPTRSRSEKP